MSNHILVLQFVLIALAAKQHWAAPSVSFLPSSSQEICLSHIAEDAEPTLELITAMDDSAAVRSFVKCLAADMGLWTDKDGYNAQKIATLFKQQNMSDEIIVVVSHCNQSHRNENDLPKWAYDAYKCATSGRMGEWVKEHVKGVYGEKIVK